MMFFFPNQVAGISRIVGATFVVFIFWVQSGGQTCKLNCHNVLEAPHFQDKFDQST